jgi:prepilin-type processing-associated H-X9-DG protein
LGNVATYPNGPFRNESGVQNPVLTPMFMDSTWINLDPVKSDSPAGNLYTGDPTQEGMPRVTIVRHGGMAPGSAPRNIPPVTASIPSLPGAINMGFVDGHAEKVKLQNLWTYYWHRNW